MWCSVSSWLRRTKNQELISNRMKYTHLNSLLLGISLLSFSAIICWCNFLQTKLTIEILNVCHEQKLKKVLITQNVPIIGLTFTCELDLELGKGYRDGKMYSSVSQQESWHQKALSDFILYSHWFNALYHIWLFVCFTEIKATQPCTEYNPQAMIYCWQELVGQLGTRILLRYFK